MSSESLDIHNQTPETATLLSTQGTLDFANNLDSGNDDGMDSDWQTVEIESAYKQVAPKFRSFLPLRRLIPIIALAAQFIMLALIILIIWISAKHKAVPSLLACLYLEYSQFVPTVVTLTATLLSLINTQLFAEAVRFSIAVSLGNPESNGMSLYSFYAATVISSRSPLFNLNMQCIRWALISIISFSLFLAQTAAWATILTPKQITIPSTNQINLMDHDFSHEHFYNNDTRTITDPATLVFPWAQSASSGIAAIRRMSNQTQIQTYFDHVLNGTTHGILPYPNISYGWNNWTHIEVIQQGFAVDVTCKKATSFPPGLFLAKTPLNEAYVKNLTQIITICGFSNFDLGSPSNIEVSAVVYSDGYPYVILNVCGGNTDRENPEPSISIITNGPLISNLTCGLKLKLSNFNVTYNNSGLVTLSDPMYLPVPLVWSHPIWRALLDLPTHFLRAQSFHGNNIIDMWNTLTSEEQAWPSPIEFTEVAMAEYIRGVFEQILTTYRQDAVFHFGGTVLNKTAVTSKMYAVAIVWGGISSLKLAITVVPLVIMVTTICIILLSIRRARGLTPKHIVSFNPMNMLHIIAACSSGNINARNALFPDYNKNIGRFGNDLRVRLPAGQEGAASGFQVDRVV